MLQGHVDGQEHRVDLPAQQVRHGGGGAPVADVGERNLGPVLQQLHRQVVRRARTGRAVVERAGLGPGAVHQVLERFDPGPGRRHQQQLPPARLAHRHQVRQRVEALLGVQRHVHHQRVHADQQRGAVGRGAHHLLCADDAGRPRLVLHKKRALEPVRQRLRNLPRNQVNARAGRERHHQPHRSIDTRLRPGPGRSGGCRGSQRAQHQAAALGGGRVRVGTQGGQLGHGACLSSRWKGVAGQLQRHS